jgi:AAA ATPase domain
MIEQVELHNFKSHRSTKLNFDDSHLHALVGQNSSGKTSVLQALYYLCQLTISPSKNIFKYQQSPEFIVTNLSIVKYMSVTVSGSWRRSDEHQWTAGYKFNDRTFYQPTVFWNTANKGNHEVKGEDSSLMNAEPTIRESLRLLEKVEWLEPDTLDHLVQWSGLESGTEHSCWKNIGDIIEHFSNEFNFPRIRSNGKLKTDGKAASKVMKLISFLQYKLKRDITAVIFIRDLDNQPERRQHLDQARSEYTGQPKLEIVIGTADRMREAWVLNGFMPLNPEEEKILKEITKRLTFDPCIEADRLRSTSSDERYPKMVLPSR